MAYTYTLQEQLDKLSELVGDSNTSTDDAFPLARRKKMINMGELAFARDSKILKEYTTGTVAGSELAIPADWIETFVLIINNEVISNDKEIALADYERYYNVGQEAPYWYFWEFSGTRKMKFIGTACNGKTYQLYYFKKPTTELSDAADVSLLPVEYREASVYWAAAELMLQIGKTDLSLRYKGMYGDYVAKAIGENDKHYINKEYARPDFGPDKDSTADIDTQGSGIIY